MVNVKILCLAVIFQSSEEDLGTKDSSDSSTSRKITAGKRSTPAKVKAGSRNKATHVSVKNQKEALHPDIEQILGQSQAGSLPFIMALCNDLMTGSGHSSTGSYDTATLRSSDSHPDCRRWSTCGPGETSMGTESAASLKGAVAATGSGARPYSWHSEHLDLNATLSTMASPPRRTAPHPQQPQLPPALDNHHSFPHDLYAASSAPHPVLWAQANSGGSIPYGGSLDRYSPELIAHQLMIPSRLSSGGHSVSDSGSIGHHKALKENVGIA